MLIVDDLTKIILEGLTDHINRSYFTTLKNQRQALLMHLEEEKITKEQFQKEDERLSLMIKQLGKELRNKPSNSANIGF